MKAYLSEITESIQGEGTLAGSRQIFLRFAGVILDVRIVILWGAYLKPHLARFF